MALSLIARITGLDLTSRFIQAPNFSKSRFIFGYYDGS